MSEQNDNFVNFSVGFINIRANKFALCRSLSKFLTPTYFHASVIELSEPIYKEEYFKLFIEIATGEQSNIWNTLEEHSSPDYLIYLYCYSDYWGFDLLKQSIEEFWTKHPDSFSFSWNNSISSSNSFFSEFLNSYRKKTDTQSFTQPYEVGENSSITDILSAINSTFADSRLDNIPWDYQKEFKKILLQSYYQIKDFLNKLPKETADDNSKEKNSKIETTGLPNFSKFCDFCSRHFNSLLENNVVYDLPPPFLSTIFRQVRENNVPIDHNLLCECLIRIFNDKRIDYSYYGDILSYLDFTQVKSETLYKLSLIKHITALFDEVRVHQFHKYAFENSKKIAELESSYKELKQQYDLLNEATSNQLSNFENILSEYEYIVANIDNEDIQKYYKTKYDSQIRECHQQIGELNRKVAQAEQVRKIQIQLDEKINALKPQIDQVSQEVKKAYHKYDIAFSLMKGINARYQLNPPPVRNQVLFETSPAECRTKDLLFFKEGQLSNTKAFQGFIYMKFVKDATAIRNPTAPLNIETTDSHAMIKIIRITILNPAFFNNFKIDGFFSNEPIETSKNKLVHSLDNNLWFTIIHSTGINMSDKTKKVYHYQDENGLSQIVVTLRHVPIVKYLRLSFSLSNTQGLPIVSISSIDLEGEVIDSFHPDPILSKDIVTPVSEPPPKTKGKKGKH